MLLTYYAHSKEGESPNAWQALDQHLKNVAETAGKYAATFGAFDWGWAAGWLHDLGKYSRQFQAYLMDENALDAGSRTGPGRVDHSTAGAQYSIRVEPILGHLLAYPIAGHHAGLLNGRGTTASQETRLGKSVYPFENGLQFVPAITRLEPPDFLRQALARKDAFSAAFFVRMLFSCLVDADFLDTEAFMNPEQAAIRARWPDSVLERMEEAVTAHVSRFPAPDNLVNQQRAAVREACLMAAEQPPGLFSLSVPTGGGKTLASLAFGLRHAIRHGLMRIIYVAPLTSIIEQNADVFRQALRSVSDTLGRDVVLEHHSNLDPETETAVNRLMAENWDAPLIVTTSVQFYESLFAHKTSRCRKLHRVARSVIILDEAQTLPVAYLEPCLRALQELTKSYGASIVVCTATQPAIEKREDFPVGLPKPYEIIADRVRLYNDLQRVRVEDIGKQNDEALCRRLWAEPQVLCIVNIKSHARKLFDAVGAGGDHYHLSGNMCPAHRSETIKQIRRKLLNGSCCRVISTQVIEAGVDIDFPVVYRSLAGLDSIAQAAGRCNRNGRLPEYGRTYIFRSEHTRSERFFAETAQCAGQVLSLHENPMDLAAVEHYFRLYYWDQSSRWDEKQIMDETRLAANDPKFPFNFGFQEISRNFQLIDEANYRSVIIPWQESGWKLCERLRSVSEPTLKIRRQLQRYVVQVPRWMWERHLGTDIQEIHDGFWVLVSPTVHYSEDTGLNLEADEPGWIFA